MDKNNNIDDDINALSPEEIKAIGEIELGPSKQEQFLNQHYKKLIIGGVALMVAISAGICIASFRQQHQDAGAAAVLGVAKVTAPGMAADISEYDTKALADIQSVYDETDSATTASLMEGLAQLGSEATTAAGLERLEGLAASDAPEFVRARALSAIALHYMDNDAVDKAAEAWKKVTQLPLNAYTGLAYLSLSDLARNAGKIDEARTYLDLLDKECPNSPLSRGQMGKLRRLLLETDEPEPVAPAPAVPTEQPDYGTPKLPDFNTPAIPGMPAASGTSPQLPGTSL